MHPDAQHLWHVSVGALGAICVLCCARAPPGSASSTTLLFLSPACLTQPRSRYTGRYDSDRRSRSPARERSPDRYNDRVSQYGDSERRRLSGETRSNQASFQSNRDNFRDPISRDPPRGPKALVDVPNGPRVGSYASDFRGHPRAAVQGRSWIRDDSRDKGPRDRDDFRDRRDPPFRDERSRERERDWRDRDFRGRWPSPPPGGRGLRSPLGRGEPGRELIGRDPREARDPRDSWDPRDTRDPRDVRDLREQRDRDPLPGPDAGDRPRRGSRDGPLSAGSLSSEPGFNSQAYRGASSARGRPAMGRGRPAEWERGRGGRANSIYDERDRYPRSRSQEGRWPRNERDERDNYRYSLDGDLRPRDGRDPRDERDPRDRDAPWPKQDRSSLPRDPIPRDSAIPPISPPPIPPSAPAFGSVPARPPSISDGPGSGSKPMSSASSKPGYDEKPPLSAGSQISAHSDSTGASAISIPTGPRLQQPLPPKPQRPSSIQWVNPNQKLPARQSTVVSPKTGRSQSFVLQQGRPFVSRPGSAGSEQSGSRPHSSDAKSEPPHDTDMTDVDQRSEPGEIIENAAPPPTQLATDRDAKPIRPLADSDTKKPTGIFAVAAAARNSSLAKENYSLSSARSATGAETEEKPAPHDDQTPPQKPQASAEPEQAKGSEPVKGEQASAGAPVKTEDSTKAPSDAAQTREKLAVDSNKDTKTTDTPMEVDATTLDLNPPVEVPALMVSVRRGSPASTAPDRGSDSEEEDMNDYFDVEIEKHEMQLKALQEKEDAIPTEGATRAALIESILARELLDADLGLSAVGGLVPEDVLSAWRKADAAAQPAKKQPAATVAPAAAAVEAFGAKPSTSKPAGPEQAEDAMDVDVTLKAAQLTTSNLAFASGSSHTAARPSVKTEQASTALATSVQDTVVALPGAAAEQMAVDGAASEADPSLSKEVGDSPPALEQGRGSRPSSPSQPDDDDATEIEEFDTSAPDVARFFMSTPPPEDLPDYSCVAWNQDEQFLNECKPSTEVDAFILSHMRDLNIVKLGEQQTQRSLYRENYKAYLQFTRSDDTAAVKSREKYIGVGGYGMSESPAPSTPPAEPAKPEGRTSGRRFASERDLERVLQASLREEDERKERELRAQKEKYRSEKEAVIPEMYWTDTERVQELFIDRSGFLPPEKMITAWQVLPPIINFTAEEAEQFEKAYMEFPKQWGRIAEQIPTRDFHACIQYYYSVKKELNLKEKLKRQPRRRKKGARSKQRSSALVSELGNPDEVNDEATAEGENGERRRPRRAAAPTWGFEAAAAAAAASAAADSDGTTPVGTPGRRGRHDADKPDGRRNRRRAAKDKEKEAKEKEAKEAKEPKDSKELKDVKEVKEPKESKEPKETKDSKYAKTVLLPAPDGSPAGSKASRSRSNSRAQDSPRPPGDGHLTVQQQQQQQRRQPSPHVPQKAQQHGRKDGAGIGTPPTVTPIPIPTAPPSRMTLFYDGAAALSSGMHPPPHMVGQPGMGMDVAGADAKPMPGYGTAGDKAVMGLGSSIGETLAPPSLRPEPPPPLQIGISNFDVNVANPERFRSSLQPSSYWSVSESNDFPALLRSFGTEWQLIAQHMQTKTAVMVSSPWRHTAGMRAFAVLIVPGQKLLCAAERRQKGRVRGHCQRGQHAAEARRQNANPPAAACGAAQESRHDPAAAVGTAAACGGDQGRRHGRRHQSGGRCTAAAVRPVPDTCTHCAGAADTRATPGDAGRPAHTAIAPEAHAAGAASANAAGATATGDIGAAAAAGSTGSSSSLGSVRAAWWPAQRHDAAAGCDGCDARGAGDVAHGAANERAAHDCCAAIWCSLPRAGCG